MVVVLKLDKQQVVTMKHDVVTIRAAVGAAVSATANKLSKEQDASRHGGQPRHQR